MTVKLLEPERFSELPVPVSDLAVVAVMEDPDSKEIVGYAVGQPVWHLEPMWVREDLRSSRAAVQLFAGALAAMRANGIYGFYTQATTEEHAGYLLRLGLTPLPYIPFEGKVPPIEE